MTPPRRSGPQAFPPARGSVVQSVPIYEVIKTRILIKLQDRLDPAKSRRMPPALFAETARQLVEQVIEVEAARMTRPDRDRLAREVFGEAFGYGPLDELITDAGVKEFTVLGPQAVIARRDGGWLPTNVKFRDADHFQDVLDKVRGNGEAVGGALPASVLDVKLGNGFRVVGVMPPPLTGQPPTVTFVRSEVPAGTGTHAALTPPAAATPAPATPAPPPRSGDGGRGSVTSSASSATRSPAPGEYPLERHRVRITERLIGRLARLGVYDLSGIETGELRKVVAAYVDEYCQLEKVCLSAADQDRLTRDILTAMNR